MLYQWGRKDGFPGADGRMIQENETATTIPLYGADGGTLAEGSETGLQKVDITTSGVLNGNTSLIYTIKNPLTFIYSLTSPQDWYTDNEIYQNDVLWDSKGTKSVLDPCPGEWRTAMDAEHTYGDFSMETMSTSSSNYTAQTGRTYSNMAWFPASGYRRVVSGGLNSVGNIGYYWSASVSSTRVIFMHFTMNDVVPSSTCSRAYGFSVRCVQE